jgi:hypothetical protein
VHQESLHPEDIFDKDMPLQMGMNNLSAEIIHAASIEAMAESSHVCCCGKTGA